MVVYFSCYRNKAQGTKYQRADKGNRFFSDYYHLIKQKLLALEI